MATHLPHASSPSGADSLSGGSPGGELPWSDRLRPDLPALVLGITIAIGVCAPYFGGGRLLLLDWVLGPHAPILSRPFYGLNGGLTSGIPTGVVVGILNHILGAPATWLPLFAFFPIAAVSIGRLVGGRQLARVAAAALFTVNPFVLERISAGDLGLLLGYAFLPLAVKSAVDATHAVGWRRCSPALWWAVLTALSPHFAWIFGVVMLAVVATVRPLSQSLRSLGASLAAFAVMSAYLILPSVVAPLPLRIGAADLLIFQTRGDLRFGLYPNVLGLYGFWREVVPAGPRLPKYEISGWPIFLLAILVIATYGAWTALRSRDRRTLGWVVLAAGAAGFLLTLGTHGPTGFLYRLAYEHLPFFGIMREPGKFMALQAFAYAVFFGWGVERLFAPGWLHKSTTEGAPISGRRLTGRVAVLAGTALALPLVYTPTIFDGLAGFAAPSRLPPSWVQADALMGTGPGRALFLPWHLYMEFPFAGNRDIANPAPWSFRRTVISGDNIEAGTIFTESTSPQSAYLESLFRRGSKLTGFGSLVAPLGVQYVLLAHVPTVDFPNYSWVRKQHDLRQVLSAPTLQVWENTDYRGIGFHLSAGEAGAIPPSPVGTGVPSGQASPGAYGKAAPTPVTSGAPVTLHQLSPVDYSVPPGIPGRIAIAEPYQPGWSLNGLAARKSPWGTLDVFSGGRGGSVSFGPWTQARLGYLISALAFLWLLLTPKFWKEKGTSRI